MITLPHQAPPPPAVTPTPRAATAARTGAPGGFADTLRSRLDRIDADRRHDAAGTRADHTPATGDDTATATAGDGAVRTDAETAPAGGDGAAPDGDEATAAPAAPLATTVAATPTAASPPATEDPAASAAAEADGAVLRATPSAAAGVPAAGEGHRSEATGAVPGASGAPAPTPGDPAVDEAGILRPTAPAAPMSADGTAAEPLTTRAGTTPAAPTTDAVPAAMGEAADTGSSTTETPRTGTPDEAIPRTTTSDSVTAETVTADAVPADADASDGDAATPQTATGPISDTTGEPATDEATAESTPNRLATMPDASAAATERTVASRPDAATATAATTSDPAPAPADGEPVPASRLGATILPEATRMRGTAAHRTLEIRLDPPDLGTVDLEIRSSGSTVSVVARTESAEAMLAVLRQRDVIEASLRQHGMDLSGFDVSAGTPDRDRTGAGGDAAPRAMTRTRDEATESGGSDTVPTRPAHQEGTVFL